MKLIIRWLIAAVAVAAAAWLVPGIEVTSSNGVITVLVMALVLGLVNAIIRPILAFFSCGCIVATLGLFMLVINAFTFWFAGYITSEWLDLGFKVDSFWAALLGSIIVSVVSFLLSIFLPDDKIKEK